MGNIVGDPAHLMEFRSYRVAILNCLFRHRVECSPKTCSFERLSENTVLKTPDTLLCTDHVYVFSIQLLITLRGRIWTRLASELL